MTDDNNPSTLTPDDEATLAQLTEDTPSQPKTEAELAHDTWAASLTPDERLIFNLTSNKSNIPTDMTETPPQSRYLVWLNPHYSRELAKAGYCIIRIVERATLEPVQALRSQAPMIFNTRAYLGFDTIKNVLASHGLAAIHDLPGGLTSFLNDPATALRWGSGQPHPFRPNADDLANDIEYWNRRKETGILTATVPLNTHATQPTASFV